MTILVAQHRFISDKMFILTAIPFGHLKRIDRIFTNNIHSLDQYNSLFWSHWRFIVLKLPECRPLSKSLFVLSILLFPFVLKNIGRNRFYRNILMNELALQFPDSWLGLFYVPIRTSKIIKIQSLNFILIFFSYLNLKRKMVYKWFVSNLVEIDLFRRWFVLSNCTFNINFNVLSMFLLWKV